LSSFSSFIASFHQATRVETAATGLLPLDWLRDLGAGELPDGVPGGAAGIRRRARATSPWTLLGPLLLALLGPGCASDRPVSRGDEGGGEEGEGEGEGERSGEVVVDDQRVKLYAGKSEDALFLTYIAHLFGGKVDGARFDFACCDVTNQGTEEVRVRVAAVLVGYSTETTVTESVAAGRSVTICVNPVFDRRALADLDGPVNSQVRLTVEDLDRVRVVDEWSRAATVLPLDSILIDPPATLQLAAALVTPHAPRVEDALDEVAELSEFGTFGMGGYRGAGQPVTRAGLAIDAGRYLYETLVLEAGEELRVELVSVSGGTAADIDLYVVDPANLAKLQAGEQFHVLAIQENAQTGATFRFLPGSGGSFSLVLGNSSDDWVSRSVTYRRTRGRIEVAYDYLAAIYSYLQGQGQNYINIPGDAWNEGLQRVRLPDDMLRGGGGNCIDGSLLFASFLELAGVDPVILIVPGHAFVGVKSAAGSGVVWPIETTMMGSGTPALEAFTTGVTEMVEAANEGTLQLLDIAAARNAGLSPIP